MFSRKKIAALSALIGGLAAASTGVTPAHAAGDPSNCTRDLQGNTTCVQHVKGEIPENGTIPHQESCLPTSRVTLPAGIDGGTTRIGPQVTCSPGAPERADGKR
ncbi:hypothetical protein [Streptomyces sp. NPDC003401]